MRLRTTCCVVLCWMLGTSGAFAEDLAKTPPSAPILVPLPPGGAEGSGELPTTPQAPPAPFAEPLPPSAEQPDTSAIVIPIHDAWQNYNTAFSATVAGRDDEAITLLRRVISQDPSHPAALHARELLRIIEARLTGYVPQKSATNLGMATLHPPVAIPVPKTIDEFARRMREESPTNSGQVTLVLGQTLSGLAFGLEVCFIFGCPHPALGTISVLGGAGLGLTLSLVLSSRGVTVGHALSLGVGGVWGLWNAGATVGLLMQGEVLPDRGQVSLPFGLAMGQLVGTLVGEVAYQVMKPGDGDVWAAVSTAGWSIVVTLLVGAAINPNGGLVLVPETIIAGDLGLALGGIFAMLMPMGSGRVWAINAGGMLGSLAGLLVSAIILPSAFAAGASSSAFGAIVAGSTAGGIVFGLGLAAYLTRNMDVPSIPGPRFTLMATSTGGVTPGIAFKL